MGAHRDAKILLVETPLEAIGSFNREGKEEKMMRPIVIDVDGTMSRPDRSIPGSVIDRLHEWAKPVVIATGKAFPYPVALCDFIGIEVRVIAENGGVCCVGDSVEVLGNDEKARKFVRALNERGYDLGWGRADLVNRWRETEVAVNRSVPRAVVDVEADRFGLEVVDSQYAFHVKSPELSKGSGLEAIVREMRVGADAFVAIGDSENDLSTFGVAGVSIAVSNANERLREAADWVTDAPYAEGLLEALEAIETGRV